MADEIDEPATTRKWEVGIMNDEVESERAGRRLQPLGSCLFQDYCFFGGSSFVPQETMNCQVPAPRSRRASYERLEALQVTPGYHRF